LTALAQFLILAIKRAGCLIPMLQIISFELAIILVFVGGLNNSDRAKNTTLVLAMVFIAWTIWQGGQVPPVLAP